jgi:peptidoglycan/LPS O-acetylase OafA/YrhL
MSSKNYIPELDGLRGIAALMVVFHHMAQQFPAFTPHNPWERFLRIWIRVTTPGWMGVDIFFVLSGFLISGILLDSSGNPHFYRNFYMKRILRIFPLYYLTLVVVLLFFANSRSFVVLSAFYLSNFGPLFGIPLVFAPLWSLSVEEHFYFIWPWVIKFGRMRGLIVISTLIFLLEPGFRYYAFQHGFFDPYFSWFRFDGLALGALVMVASKTLSSVTLERMASGAFSAAIVLFCASLPFGGYTRMAPMGTATLYTCISLFTASMIGFIYARPGNRLFSILRTRFLKLSGDISFCVYLIHLFIILEFYRLLETGIGRQFSVTLQEKPVLLYLIQSTVVLACCFAIGILSKDYFEGPIRRYRFRFE